MRFYWDQPFEKELVKEELIVAQEKIKVYEEVILFKSDEKEALKAEEPSLVYEEANEWDHFRS